MLHNLVANAVRFGDPGGAIEFALREDDGSVRLSVTNTGTPVADEHKPRLFERFFRGDPARGRAEGAGLGLSLSREIARAHGGDLALERSEGGRTTFVLALPAIRA